jgi:hypothetical protein
VYTLDYTAADRTICALGDRETLALIARNSGAVDFGEVVTIPASRTAFLSLEAMGQAEMTFDYLNVRRATLRPSRESLQAVEERLRQGLNGFLPSLLLHQWEFLAHHVATASAFNASEQGLGKTRMALAWLVIKGVRRVIALMPKDLAKQWEGELPNIWPDAANRPTFVNLTTGTKQQRSDIINDAALWQSDKEIILAVNYEVLADLVEALSAFAPQAIIADESWKIKNPTAKVTKAAIKIADTARGRGRCYCLALAGTPIGNNIGDLWSQLRFLGRHLAPMSYSAFLMRYAELKPLRLPARTIQVPVGVADPMGLMELLAPCWFRATKAACLNLPPKVRRDVRLRMTRDQKHLYASVVRDGERPLGNELSLASQAIVNLRLQQIAGGNRPTFNVTGAETMVGSEPHLTTDPAMDWATEPIADCPKIEWLKTWADTNLLAYGATRCIVWCRFNAEVRRVTAALQGILGKEKVAAVTGGTKGLDAIKESFKSRRTGMNEVQVIVAQIAKLNNGHDLQEADWSIYFSPTWSYIQFAQSEDRNHRIGRTEEVNYIHLIAEGTIDEDAWAALNNKESLSARFTPNIATPTAAAV